jgi:hypothetical protein
VLPDTAVVLGFAVTRVQGDAPATLFTARFSSVRRGPAEFAASWSTVFKRTPDSQPSGAGDPKLFLRLQLPFPKDWPVRFHLEFAARVPTSSPDLYPYATGGQDLEIMGSAVTRGVVRAAAGFGRILANPPSGSTLGESDVPDASHAWALLAHGIGPVVLAARVDGLLYDLEEQGRGIVTGSLSYQQRPNGLVVAFEWAMEFGGAENRVFDRAPTLRFAIPLR